MSTNRGTVATVLLPLDSAEDGRWAELVSAVLADWFDASLQVVARTAGSLDRCYEITDGTGVASASVVDLSDPTIGLSDTDDFMARLGARSRAAAPSVCVLSDGDAARELLESSNQPVFVARRRRGATRFGAGPLVVPISGRASDVDSLAVAAAWAAHLGGTVRLVTVADVGERDRCAAHERLLSQMGIDVETDLVSSPLSQAVVEVAAASRAVAVVVSQDAPLMQVLLARSDDPGISVLVAPLSESQTATDSVRAAPVAGIPPLAVAEPGGMTQLSEEDCLTKLGQHTVGRLGYVDGGWPVVVPVNYSTAGNEVIIRSLPGGKLEAAKRGDVVCLEIDGFGTARTGWSVLLHGELEPISNPAELRAAWEADPAPWIAGLRFEWLRLKQLNLSGRAIEASAESG